MENPKFQVFKSTSNSQYYYRLRAINGEIILSGEKYLIKKSCFNNIQSVKANALYDYRYQRKQSVNYQYYFVLTTANGEIIGKSELYKTTSAREIGIASVKGDAPFAPTEDLT
jgi:uncharacterized protein YegP (UPF0339 family)